jgi:hypothetical protein
MESSMAAGARIDAERGLRTVRSAFAASVAEVALEHARDDGGRREVPKGAPDVAALVAVLKPPSDHAVESRPDTTPSWPLLATSRASFQPDTAMPMPP